MNDDLYQAKKEVYKGKRERRISRYRSRAKRAAEESQAAFKSADQISNVIPFGQPILVGHHSEKGARRDANRIDNNMRKGCDLEGKAEYYAEKADAAEHNRAISSDNPDSVDLLKKKVENLEKIHDFHVRCNKEWKKHKAKEAKGNAYTMQLTDQEKTKMLTDMNSYPAYQTKNQPYPSYILTSLTAKIRAAKQRIKELEAHNTKYTETQSYSPEGLPGITVEKDVVENRLKIYPPGKEKSFALGLPAIFKRLGFRWSPTNGCYQRNLVGSSFYEQQIIKEFKAIWK